MKNSRKNRENLRVLFKIIVCTLIVSYCVWLYFHLNKLHNGKTTTTTTSFLKNKNTKTKSVNQENSQEEISAEIINYEDKPPPKKALPYNFEDLLKSNVSVNDPRLLNYIRRKIKKPIKRGSKSYKLTVPNDKNPTQLNGEFKELLYNLLEKIKKGFYIDCGASNGEYLSNTLYLDKYKSWDGLLIEANPILLKSLYSKNRVAWISNFCLSNVPQKIEFLHRIGYDLGGFDRVGPSKDFKISKLIGPESYTSLGLVECVPLYSILLAINVTNIDFLSLDVEGLELAILEAIPFDKINFKIILVEYVWGPPNSGDKIKELLKSKNFILKGDNFNDFLFVHESFNNV